jgi:hypothetical protein
MAGNLLSGLIYRRRNTARPSRRVRQCEARPVACEERKLAL